MIRRRNCEAGPSLCQVLIKFLKMTDYSLPKRFGTLAGRRTKLENRIGPGKLFEELLSSLGLLIRREQVDFINDQPAWGRREII